jgi:hypothetical protein
LIAVDATATAGSAGVASGSVVPARRKAMSRISIRSAELGPRLSSRKHSDVYLFGDDRVVKFFGRHVPVTDVEREQHVAMTMHVRGLPVPATDERLAKCDDGRHGIVFERIPGSTVAALYNRTPWKLFALTRMLAATHVQSFETRAFDGLRSQREMLRERIARASSITLRERQQLLGMLDELPDSGHFCHGNFQPGNLMITPDGKPVILSWGDACIGNPASDIARSALILSVPGRSRGKLGSYLAAAYGSLQKRTYLQQALQSWPALAEHLQPWLAINAAVRMEEGISPIQREQMARLVRNVLANPREI